MIDFDFNQDCCGCTSCANSCPVSAIIMQKNEEGFLIPVVNNDTCINCGKCEISCPHLNTPMDYGGFSLDSIRDKKAYLYYSNSKRRKDSASGGFVYDAMSTCLKEGGLICGCVWDNNMKAVHILSDKLEDLFRMQSSKYVQSDMGNSFSGIKVALKNGRKVVFCGTPCQTAGLHFFLENIDTTNLISICLICHGVPSPGVWQKWVDVMEKKYRGKLVNVNMRDKSYKGYKTSYSKYTFVNLNGCVDHQFQNVGMSTYLEDTYIFLFTDDLYLRHSCNRCQYKAEHNGADIIVGDFYASTEGAGNLGCSCMIAMNKKGEDYIVSLDGAIKVSNIVEIGSVNSMLWKSVLEHPKRQVFFDRFKQTTDVDESLFMDFLPFRFKVKKILNKMGLFDMIQAVLKLKKYL